MARKQNPKAHVPGTYNATLWQINENGDAFSVCVVEFVDGKILRSNHVTCTGLEGSPRYHDYYLGSRKTFAGKPVKHFVSMTTKGFRDAICGGIAKTFKTMAATEIN